MKLETRDFGEIRVVSVGDSRIDAAVAVEFRDAMREVTSDGPPTVVLDLSNVVFLDSSGLGAVVAAMKQAAPERRLELAGLQPMVEKVFRLTRMDSVFRIHQNTEGVGQGSAHVG
ncbi:MAG: anti-sigma factor antagonist [Alphaproteobacteria bacterium]|nr:MAG: anti-sigma factor antagonist [Alphaproteobacteria bacterium]